MKLFLFFIIFTLISLFSFSQDDIKHSQENYTLNISKVKDKITLDGKLDELTWTTNNSTANDFWNKFPTNDSKAKLKTDVKISFDDKFLYIGAICYDSSQSYLLTSLKRDQGLRSGDGLGIVLDPFNKKSNGFFFVVTPYNTQSEDLLTGGGDDVDFSWDNKWFSKTTITDQGWIAEIAIPFNILRYDAEKKVWGINFLRSDRKTNEFHTWTRIPLQFRGLDIGYCGQLLWEIMPPKIGTNISVNPYLSSNITQNEDKKISLKANTGFDAKVAVTKSLNLDLTVNPDFSQVDVDQQVSNLSRFSIFFPERRSFFLENNDLFSRYGFPPLRPFYSRKIGSKEGIAVPILFGARLSGNITNTTRIGVMNIQTGKKDELTADNFSAISVNQRVLNRSSFNGYFFNRQGSIKGEVAIKNPLEKFGRNAGLEFVYTNTKGDWNAWISHHISLKPNINTKNKYSNTGFQYSGQNLSATLDFNATGENFYTDMGFENLLNNYDASRDTSIRLGNNLIYNELKYTFYGNKKKKWNTISLGLENIYQATPDGKAYENNHEFNFNFNTKQASGFNISIENTKSFLRFPFKFTIDDASLPLPAATYNYYQYGANYYSDSRKDFAFNVGFTLGKFYNANFNKYNAEVTIRKQPKYTFRLRTEYNLLDFPSIYGKEEIFIVAPSFEYNFSNNIFWTTFFQLNSQNNNININSRLQYRFKPMSDLFIVYTDNYLSTPLFVNKNRALVLKLNYWLNI